MKKRPILFSAPMVRALLDDSKTQTRRPVKPAPEMVAEHRIEPWAGDPAALLQLLQASKRLCPYGKPGDRLWVRETFLAYGRWETRFSAKKKRDEWHFTDMTLECDRRYQYAADNPDVPLVKGRAAAGTLPGWHTRPAIFTPRHASRILLEIVSVRVERLNDCSEADARAEGVAPNWIGPLDKGPNGRGGEGWPGDDYLHYTNGTDGEPAYSAHESFASLWESINGAGSWDANPWVWVVAFKRVAS